ncbi:hypothetical protein [Marinobacterium aestuariivivens]|uniref:GerMN domain-containing protein n=1 Tax=Marinobacterium aestuariivivens TaxID=1698799 RepID=A0ABW2A6B1_9GAMM
MLRSIASGFRSVHLIAGGLLILLILSFLVDWSGEPQRSGESPLVVLSEAEDAQWIRLPAPAVTDRLDRIYMAESEPLRAQVLQNLGEFRAAYQQLAPSLEVRVAPGLKSRQRLAERLGAALSHFGLGRARAGFDLALPGQARPAMLARCSGRDAEILRRLLAALSPYLAGDVLVQFDDSLRIDEIGLYLLGEPRFNEEGVAIFGNWE